MTKILSYLGFIVIAIVGVTFASLNPMAVEVNYLFSKVVMPLSVLLVIVLGAGILIGLTFGLLIYIRLKAEIYSLKHRVRAAQEEVDNLRTLPISDSH